MGTYASVESFEALKRLRVGVCKFAELVTAGLGEAEAELRRTSDWVKSEKSNYWKLEGRKRAEQLKRAKSALASKKLQKTPTGGRPSCVEEEKALAVAQARVEEAEKKQENVRRWSHRLDEETYLYQAVASTLHQALTVDVPRALARLDDMLTALEGYAASAAPQVQGSIAAAGLPASAIASGEQESMARGVPVGPESFDEYRLLRALTPVVAHRDSVPIAEPGPAAWRALTPGSPWLADLAALSIAGLEPAVAERIVFAEGVADHPRIYFQRLAGVSVGDSGWYVGPVDVVPAARLGAVRVGDVLGLQPDLAPLLNVPPGYLVVLHGGKLEAVLDADDKPVWPAGAPSPEKPAGRAGVKGELS